MNVMKNEFLSKQKKLRVRSQKYAKSNLLGFHTVSRGFPIASSSGILRVEETGKSSGVYESTITTSRLDITSTESTSEESFGKTFSANLIRKASDDNETHFADQELSNSRTGLDFDPTTNFKNLLESLSTIRETPMSDNFSFGRVQKKPKNYSTSESERVFDVRCQSRVRLRCNSTSEQTSFYELGSDEFNIEDLTQDVIHTHQTLIPSSTRYRYRSTPPSKKSVNPSGASFKSYEMTPGSKSLRSTPKTSGSGRITSSDSETGSYILAVTEGRGHARGEVGIAAIDPRRPHLILCQISDNQRYIHSLTKMSVFNFVEIIMPNTFIDGSSVSKLYLDIREHFPHVTIMSVQRRHFNEAAGLELINQYSSPESGSIMVLVRDKFYALSAASALIKYVEYSQNVLFAPRSVKVEYRGTDDSMIIDLNTANRLELVVSRINSESLTNNTLLGVLKQCRTKGGIRLLRANILQPPRLLSKIEKRLDCITELIRKPLFFFALESAISNFLNVEGLLTFCMHEPQQDGLRAAEFQLKYVLLLKTVLELVPTLRTSLEEGTCEFYSEVKNNLADVRYKIILDKILEVVPENVKSTKGSLSAHLHSCFAIKTGINGLLDIAKKTYCEIVQEIWDLINSLREKYNLPLKMSFSTPRGFHIQYTPERHVKAPDLPKQFILVQKAKSTYYFYTSELVALDQRSQQVLNEVKIMSNVILYELLNDIRENIGCLFNLCEYVAELDVIVGFAHVSSGQNYIRPSFGDVLHVIESRHPILDLAENERNFSIITGPNQSGKSIYIGQIALLQIMAQDSIGCYVPAKEATFRIADRLFFRMGCDDSIESNASTLIAEMREIEYLKQNLTGNSLVIIDELCRGTSVEEGTSLAFTICEELLDSTAFIFITTHYMFLTKLEEMYFNVTNYHFESQLVESESGMSLRFSHKKQPGVTLAEQYGLQIAEQTSFPVKVLATAKEIAQKLLAERKLLPEVEGLAAQYKISQQLKKELSGFNQDVSPDQIARTTLLFKTMLTVHPVNHYYGDVEMNEEGCPRGINDAQIDTYSSKNPVGTSAEPDPEFTDINKTRVKSRKMKKTRKERRTYQLCKRIRRKYKVLMFRRNYNQALMRKKMKSKIFLVSHKTLFPNIKLERPQPGR